ncbi:NADPH-dependent FMN reductase [Streptomyces sp. NPDC090025]|uniref:NADPH-dependent FMN reductase n=1 Tax=Streptomyces sp. NPDC090025 TaxID=3365922 RepID=UPI003834A1D4
MTKIAVILGSHRPGRRGEGVAAWVLGQASLRTDAEFVLVDIADFALPARDEPLPPAEDAPYDRYADDGTRRWAAAVADADGFVVVTAEHNHSVPAALKNAIDRLCPEWHDKAAGFVGYGTAGGVRAIEHLRAVFAELKVATVRDTVLLGLADDFAPGTDHPGPGTFTPRSFQAEALHGVLDQTIAWSTALGTLRGGPGPAPVAHRPR